jgi:hypothetical protein
MIDIKTSRGYTLPNKDNMLSDDVVRIAQALTAIDEDVSAVDSALLEQKEAVDSALLEQNTTISDAITNMQVQVNSTLEAANALIYAGL